MTISQKTLHFIIDPLCGWTYAAGPLMEKSLTLSNLSIRVHGGGMLMGDRRRQITPDWRAYVMPHDQRIASLSGQIFGSAYFDGLLNDTSMVLDSIPSTIAILAAEEMGVSSVLMLNHIQHAYFARGQKIVEFTVLKDLAMELGMDAAIFSENYSKLKAQIENHVNSTTNLLKLIGGQGFPSVALELTPGNYQLLNISQYYGQPQEWLSYLEKQSH